MNIVYLNHNVFLKAPRRSYMWAKYLAKKGHNVTLVAIDPNSRFRMKVLKHDGYRLVLSQDFMAGRARSGWDIWDVMNRIAYLISKDVDIVHSVDSRPICIVPAVFHKYFKNSKLILDWGDWWGRGGTMCERHISRLEKIFAPCEIFFEESFRKYADGSVVLTSALQDRCIQLGVDPKSILKLTPGADGEHITPINKKDARKRMGLKSGMHYIGYVGTLFVQDQYFLSKAFQMIYRTDKNIHLLLIGKDAPFLNDIPHSLSKNVHNTGKVTSMELFDYIASCDLMLLPLINSLANRARWPFKIGDYLSAGRPIVSTKTGDFCELIEKYKCGELVDDDPKQFASLILILLANKIKLERMGQNARAVSLSVLNWSSLTDKLERFYFSILDKK